MIEFKSECSVDLVQHCGGDHMVVAAAKVCVSGCSALSFKDGTAKNDKGEPWSDKDTFGLINYLMKHRHGCYDSETEVLTSKGWIPWPLVTGDELFATLNIHSDEVEYQHADRVVHKHITGPMVKINTSNVDMLVTPDHNMLAAPRKHAGEVTYDLYPAKDFLVRSHRVRLGGGTWKGTLHDPSQAAVVGFVAADGYVGTSIEFHLKRPRKVEWLFDHAEVTGNDDDKYRLISPSPELREWAKATYTESGDRCLPRDLLDCGDAETLQALLDGYLNGDGSVSPTGKITCSTVSRQMVNDLQELAMKCGMAAVETAPDISRKGAYGDRPLYRLTFYKERNAEPKIGWTTEDRTRSVTVVEYDGDVHCVTVPNGTLYVRRNGKPMWCGNTPFEHGSMTFYVHAPLFVWREWHRHRIGFSYNEESARYKQLDPVFYVPPRDRPMMKVDGWKPGRPKFTLCDDDRKYARIVDRLKGIYGVSYEAYLDNLDEGIDPGLARDCLNVGIFSGCWVTCNPRSMMAFLSLRVHEPEAKFVSYPLYEIDQAARKCEELFASLYPLTYKAFIENGRVAP